MIEWLKRFFCKHQWQLYGTNYSQKILDKLGLEAPLGTRVMACTKCGHLSTDKPYREKTHGSY